MKLDAAKILERANEKYLAIFMERGFDPKYSAPEEIPKIYSGQVLAMLEAIVEAVNEKFEEHSKFLETLAANAVITRGHVDTVSQERFISGKDV